MVKTCGKVLLLAAFSLVLVCILRAGRVYAASKSSTKISVTKQSTASYKRQIKVASRGVVSLAKNIDAGSIIRYAKKYLGIEYLYGAAGPSAFDCSGFTSFVMRSFGILLPHSSREQFSYGQVVPKDKLAPGDLVYFATSGGKGISHVGIYIGNDNFIHASLDGVCISSLNQKYYSSRYVSATRLIT